MNTMLFVPGLESSKSEVDFGSVNHNARCGDERTYLPRVCVKSTPENGECTKDRRRDSPQERSMKRKEKRKEKKKKK